MIISLSDFYKNAYRKIFFIFSIFILFFISAFRDGIGLDEDAYRNIYNSIRFDISSNSFSLFDYLQEPLFILFNVILIPFNSDQSIFVLFSILNSILLYLAYKSFSNFSILPILVYYSHRFLHNDLNQIRQGLISLIFLYSLIYVNKKKYYIYNLIGLFIQSGGVIYFLFKVFNRYFIKPKFVFILLFLSFFLSKILIIETLYRFVPESSKILFYLIDEKYNYTRELFKDFTFYKCILILLLMIIKYDSLKKTWFHFPLLFSSYAFGVFCLITFQNIALISGRISTLLFTVEPILIYYIVKNYSSNKTLHISYTIVFLYCFANLYLNLNSQNSPISNYKSILFK